MLVVEVQRMRSQEYPVIRIQLQNQSNITTRRVLQRLALLGQCSQVSAQKYTKSSSWEMPIPLIIINTLETQHY